jgi:glycosyltransferase involved in cell wall biosynthesis
MAATQNSSRRPESQCLRGKRAAVIVFSHYPSDPRPRREAETLVQLGMEVEVISISQSDDDARRENFNRVKVLRIPLRRRRGSKFAYFFQYGSFILVSFLLLTFRSLAKRYSIVHVHNMPDVLVFAALVPKLYGAKIILDLHDPMPELMMTIFGLGQKSASVRLLKQLEKWSIGFTDSILTVNLACKKIFSARSCAAQKVHVVMNSPDEGIFKCQEMNYQTFSERNATKPFVIMYHGSLVERHGLDIAVMAISEVKKFIPKVELRIYGQSTPFLKQVMDPIQKSDLQEAIRYLGARKLEGVVEAINECDLGIIPNRRSIFTELNTPTRIFEYLSQGKPVIAPLAPGIQDYFGPKDLIFFELGNANDLAEKIKYVFMHPEKIGEIVRRGQEIYSEHRWSRERLRFTNLVNNLLAANGPSKLEAEKCQYPILEITHDRRRSSLD